MAAVAEAGSVPGLQADCEELLGAFQEADTVRFERFAELWRERRFHTIFHGRIRALERNKLTKKTLELAQQYFLPPYAFQIRVGALYLLYGLYNTQLCQPKQKIRIALKDWPEILKFQQELIDSQHYDAAYIFRTLRLARAFHFTAMPKLLNYRTKKKIQENEFKEEFKDPSNRVSSLITNDVLEELMNIHEHYQKMKCVISADKSQPDKALSLIKDEFVVTLKDITLEHQEWQQKRMVGSTNRYPFNFFFFLSFIRHRQVKLESSESGSDNRKSPSRSRKNSRRPQPALRRGSLEFRGIFLEAAEVYQLLC
uniref:Small nuclear RNA activating complex polypeptide 1 n=1 Tax=Anas platyrhynchos platyrhynchos TaxID=8840 RepID=U3I425_ANAPP